jgi:DnaJ-class molecular chaperone
MILGVKPGASMTNIKDAYVSMCKKCLYIVILDHPDLNSSEDAKEKFAQIH